MIARILLALLLLLPVAASAQQRTFASTFLEGSWGLRLDGSIIMRFDLELTPDGWTGAWVKPTSFSSDGTRFGSIKMPSVERRADSGRAIGEWAEITFDDPRPGEEPDQFRIHLVGPDRAEMIYVGTGLPPFILERVAAGAILGPFEEGKVYGSARAASAGRPVTPAPAPTVGAPSRGAPSGPAVTPPPTAAASPSAAPSGSAVANGPAPAVTAPPLVVPPASAPTSRPTPAPTPTPRATPPANAPVQGPPAVIGR